MKIAVSKNKDLRSALEEMGVIVVKNGRRFLYLPYWFEDEDGKLIAYNLDNLPEDVKRAIKYLRNQKL